MDSGGLRRTLAATTPSRRLHCEAGFAVWIDADETRLEQILNNLLGNAVKFTPTGGRVTVDMSTQDDQAVLRVADTGAGIPAELLPRIFDLFVQGQTGLHRPAAGLGIGLTLVKRLVDLHGAFETFARRVQLAALLMNQTEIVMSGRISGI